MEERLAILQSRPLQQESEAATNDEVGEADIEDQLGQINPKELDMAQTKKIAMQRGRRRRLEAERAKLGL